MDSLTSSLLRPRARALPLLTAAALVGSVVVSGCSAHPGAAALVDGREISQTRLEQAQADLQALIPQATPEAVLTALVVAPYFIEAAADNGVAVSESEVHAYVADGAAQAGIDPVPEMGEAAVEVLRFSMASQNLQSLPDGAELLAGVEEQIAAADVDVNPRYGEFDAQAGGISRDAVPWISPGGAAPGNPLDVG